MPDSMQHRNDATTTTARIRADIVDRAHREAGRRRAAGDRHASATSILTTWAERGAQIEHGSSSP